MLLANAGLPMLFVGVPLMVLLLVPIVLVEAVWYCAALRVPLGQSLAGSLRANIWSTFVGIPLALLAWLLLGILGFYVAGAVDPYTLVTSRPLGTLYFFLASGWLPPVPEMEIVIRGACLVLLLPAYLISYLGEARLLIKRWPHLNPSHVRRHTWYAHLLSYTLLYALALYRYCSLAYPQLGW